MSRRPTGARLAAHAILEDVEDGAYADRSAERRLASLAGRERRFAMELAFGCIRLRGRLDAELATLVHRPLGTLEPSVRAWLRLGLYQLREMRVPSHAAVDEAVAGARLAAGRGAGGLVNAVLRAAAAGPPADGVFPDPGKDPLGHLTSYGSHPEWLVRRWLDRWGFETAARLVEHDNRPPPVVLRLLDDRQTCADAARAVEDAGARLRPVLGWPRSCELVEGEPGETLAHLDAVIQDPAASAVVDYAGPDLEGPVLEACAAPGTKTLVLARVARNARPLVAADVSPARLTLAAEGASRAGVDALLVAMDARRPAVARSRTVLLDAPCTGTGVLRRRPDARWRLDAARLASLVELQRDLLDACAGLVDAGGLLVYSTCSLEPEENARQVTGFLERHPDFEREEPADPPPWIAAATEADGDLLVTPWLHGTDGAYAARLRRAR